jgi:hypothetical protein
MRTKIFLSRKESVVQFVQQNEKSQCPCGQGGQQFLGLERKWFDKKNFKWLKSSKRRGNLNRKGGSVHGETG